MLRRYTLPRLLGAKKPLVTGVFLAFAACLSLTISRYGVIVTFLWSFALLVTYAGAYIRLRGYIRPLRPTKVSVQKCNDAFVRNVVRPLATAALQRPIRFFIVVSIVAELAKVLDNDCATLFVCMMTVTVFTVLQRHASSVMKVTEGRLPSPLGDALQALLRRL